MAILAGIVADGPTGSGVKYAVCQGRMSRFWTLRLTLLISAGQQAGLTVRDLNHLLEAGMSIEQLTDYLAAKLADRPGEN